MEPTENPEAGNKVISLFPLPSTVLFPQTLLPLHIFEPRYREMVRASLEDKRWIGMVLLQPGWENNYFENPPVEITGGAGEIHQWDLLEDGKYNIVLRGTSRFRIVRTIEGKSFRQAEVQLLKDINDKPLSSKEDPEIKNLLDKTREYVQLLSESPWQISGQDLTNCKTVGHLTDQIIFFSDLSAENKQSFLEELDIHKRLKTIQSFLEQKTALLRRSKYLTEKGVDFRMN